ncbi:AraC family transcriptional regulator [Paenibacillus sp. PK3_47]|uniref:AraC family transcriptional regulator n=1 Tax=Paenibacillus sp. PK3_47 TaxID=2072642 RepID=UPI00201D9700|nr:AraC family transcriptional regulator [Paenibacillus sp. PK3_47]UQZ35545.1 AraC family transcriptional regulator [Paenibacillus sp. PK3_47]
MYKRLLPLITESDKELPYYVVDAGLHWNQEHIVRPEGYLYQWIQCVEGEGELITGGKSCRVKEGAAMLLHKGAPHEYYAVSPSWIVNWLVFDGHQVDSFLNRTAGITASGALYVSRPELFTAKIQSIMDIGQSRYALKSLEWSSLVYSLLIDMVQYASIHPHSSASNLNLRLQPLFDYIDQNADKPLTLDEMAEVAGITPQHLCTVFKKTTNIRIFQYIHSVRIKKSKELLLHNPLMPIKEVALLSGFEDPNYFSTVFKKHEQLSPNQFRSIYYSKTRS